MAEQRKLTNFEARRVRRTTLKVTNAGDGLSEALRFEPRALRIGEEVNLILRGVVTQVNHVCRDPENEDDVERVHTVRTAEIALVDYDAAEPLLKSAADRLHEFRLQESLAEEKASGITRLGSDEPGADGFVEKATKKAKPDAAAIHEAARKDDGGD